jgi:hypothetical protein
MRRGSRAAMRTASQLRRPAFGSALAAFLWCVVVACSDDAAPSHPSLGDAGPAPDRDAGKVAPAPDAEPVGSTTRWCTTQPQATFCADFDGEDLTDGFDRSPCSDVPAIPAASPQSMPHAFLVAHSSCDPRIVKAVSLPGEKGIRLSFSLRIDALNAADGPRDLLPVRLGVRAASDFDRLVSDLLFAANETSTTLVLRAPDETGARDASSVQGRALVVGKWTTVSLEIAPLTTGAGWRAMMSFDGEAPREAQLPSQVRPFDTVVLVLGDERPSPFKAALDNITVLGE